MLVTWKPCANGYFLIHTWSLAETLPPHERSCTVFPCGFWFHSDDVKVTYLHLLESLPVPRALQKFVTGSCSDATALFPQNHHSAGSFLSFPVVGKVNWKLHFAGHGQGDKITKVFQGSLSYWDTQNITGEAVTLGYRTIHSSENPNSFQRVSRWPQSTSQCFLVLNCIYFWFWSQIHELEMQTKT